MKKLKKVGIFPRNYPFFVPGLWRLGGAGGSGDEIKRSGRRDKNQRRGKIFSIPNITLTENPMASNEVEVWQTKRKTIRERVAFMLNNPLMSDISFVTKDLSGAEVIFSAHKFVLAVSSPVLYAMFYGELAERKNKVELPDCDSESFLEFLRFLYCDEVKLTGSCVMQVSYLAKKYMIPELEVACTNFLTEHLSPENVFDILPHAKKFEDKELVLRCWEVVDARAEDAMRSETFSSVTKELLQEIVQRDCLTVHEINLFEAVERWAVAECERQEIEPSKENKRKVTGEEIVTNIRFPLMTQEEFAQKVPQSGLLCKDDVIELFIWFSSVSISGLKFSERPRKLVPPREFSRCKRFPQVSHGWAYSSGIPDGVVFTVDTPVYMGGVRLFGNRGLSYEVCLKLSLATESSDSDQEEVYSVEGSYLTDTEKSGGYFGFDVLFDDLVPLEHNVQYRISAMITGASSWYGSSGQTVVECDGVYFRFTSQSSPNGTNDSGGQFAEILFHIV